MAILFILTSCHSSNKPQDNSKDGLSASTAGIHEKPGSKILQNLLTEDMVRKHFEIPDSIVVKVHTDDNKIGYEWAGHQAPKEKLFAYNVNLSFESLGELNKAALDSVWQQQNKNEYKNKEIVEVKGVGDRASWSSEKGGQLRTASGNNLFYISLPHHKINRSDDMGTEDDSK